MDGVALLHLEVVHNRGILMESQYMLKEQVAAVAMSAFEQLH